MNLPPEFGAVSQSSKFVQTVRADAAQLIIGSDLLARQKQLEQERELVVCTAERSTAETKFSCLKDLIVEAYIDPLQKSGLPFDVVVSAVEPINERHRFDDDPLKNFSREGNYKMVLNLKGKEAKGPFEMVLTCNTRCADKESLKVNLWAGTSERKKPRDHERNVPYGELSFVRTGQHSVALANETDVEALKAPLVAMIPGWLHRLSQVDATVRQGLRVSGPSLAP